MIASEVDVVEAAYRVDGRDFAAWAEGLLEATAGLLDRGLGVALWHVSLSDVRDLGSHTRNTPPLYLEGADDLFEQVPLKRWRKSFGRSVWIGEGIDLLGPPFDAYIRTQVEKRYGAQSIFGAVVRASATRSLYLNAPLPRAGEPTYDRRLWLRVMMHIGAASRLVPPGREREASEDDAVLSPSGSVEHAEAHAREPDVRSQLGQAAQAIEYARTRRGRADPHAALAMWRGLVDGRWSLIERLDTDGRRFYVARRNAPCVRENHLLTHRERQVMALAGCAYSNAEIAYALGIAEGTVGSHLTRGMKKMGVARRIELVALANVEERGDGLRF